MSIIEIVCISVGLAMDAFAIAICKGLSMKKLDWKKVIIIATSIDAFAVGVTFAFFKVKLFLAVIMIGIITFILSILGVKIGNKFGRKYENKAEFIGGCVLIVMGVEMLVEHLGIL